MRKLFVLISTLLLVIVMVILPSSCTIPLVNHEEDQYDITSKFKATQNVHESFDTNSDGSITYNAVKYGGLVGLVKNHNLPVDWSGYESITFEFEDTTKVETQLLIGNTLRSWARKGVKELTCYFDGLDMKQVDQVVLQTANPTTLTIKSVRLVPATTSWDSKSIWEGDCKFGNWTSGLNIAPEQFETAVEGDKLEFVFSTDTRDRERTYWLIKPIYNATDQTLEGNLNEQNEWGCTMVGKTAKSYCIRLTSKDVKELKQRGMFVNGYFVNMTQVNLLCKGIGDGENEKVNN